MNRFDLVFNPILNEKPKLVISMKRFNHVFLGLYKGFNESIKKEEVRFFWAEHNNKDGFHRCLISNERLSCWNFDALEEGIADSYEVSCVHKKILTELYEDQYFLDNDGYLEKDYKILVKKDSNYTFMLRDEDSNQDDLSIAELEILSVLNHSWSLDTKLNFKISR